MHPGLPWWLYLQPAWTGAAWLTDCVGNQHCQEVVHAELSWSRGTGPSSLFSLACSTGSPLHAGHQGTASELTPRRQVSWVCSTGSVLWHQPLQTPNDETNAMQKQLQKISQSSAPPWAPSSTTQKPPRRQLLPPSPETQQSCGAPRTCEPQVLQEAATSRKEAA